MANISAQMVKELRDKTGAGMMDCKAALAETGGDIEAAVDWLRKKGLAKAAKKAGRVAAEGLIGVAIAGTKGVLVEVNSETDFVARNDQFQGLVRMIAQVALGDRRRCREDQGGEGRQRHASPRRSPTAIATIGENMTLRRAAELSSRQRRDRAVCAQCGLRRARQDRRARRARIGRQGATSSRRSAACSPCMSRPPTRRRSMPSGLDPAIVRREKDVLADKFKAQGKPANVIDKIVESGLKTFYKEVCLLDQAYIHDPARPSRRR